LHIAHGTVTRSVAMLELPKEVQDRVEEGDLSPSAAYQVSQIEDPDTQRAIVDRIVTQGLKRDEVVEVVRKATRSGGSKSKGRGSSKATSKLPTERSLKIDGGFKVTVAGRKGFDIRAWVDVLKEALEQAMAKLEVEQGGDQAAA
jgi:ParB-like chromosome segregation protein Spo0J